MHISLHKQKIYTIADQMLVSGGNFLVIAIALNYLTSVDFGYFTYGYSVYVVVSMVMSAFIFQPVSIMYPEIDEGSEFISRLRALNLIIVVAVGFIVCGLLYLFLLASSTLIEFVFLFLFIVFQQIADFSRKISYITHDASSAFGRSILVYPIRLLLLVLVTVDSTTELYIVLLISTLLSSSIELKFILESKIDKHVLYAMFGQLCRQSRWLLANTPLVVIWGRAPIFLLGETVGVVQAGVFMAIRNLMNIANVPLEMLETKVSATLGRTIKSNNKEYLNTLRSILIVGVITWCTGLYVLVNYSSAILKYYGSDKLLGGEDSMVVLWCANLFIFVFRLQSVHLRTTKKTVWIFCSYLLGLIILMLAYFKLNIPDDILRMSVAIVLATIAISLTQFMGIVLSKKQMTRYFL